MGMLYDFYGETENVFVNLEKLMAKMQESGVYLEMSVKDVKPCMEGLLSDVTNNEASAQMVVGDLVARLNSAQKQLSEALCLVQDAISSVSTGAKFYKESIVNVEEAV